MPERREETGAAAARVMPLVTQIADLHRQLGERTRALRASEGRFVNIISKNTDAILIIDRLGMVRFANPAAEQLLGQRRARLIGCPFGFPVCTDGPVKLELSPHRDHSVVAEMQVVETEWEGEPASLATLRDVTERERISRELGEREAHFRAVFDHAVDAILIADSDGVYREANTAAAALFGLPVEEITGCRISQFAPPEAQTSVEAGWQQCLRDGAHRGVFKVQRPDGTLRHVDYAARADFVPGRHLVVIRDITEREALQDRLRQAQKMEAVGQLTGGIAHDFNNLLTVITANCDLILSQLPGDALDLRAQVEEVESVARRGGEMIRKLLAFSRREKLKPRPLQLGRLLMEIVRVLRRILPENIEIRFHAQQDLPAVRADASAVEQILLNLATNARDAMAQGGVLNIEGRLTQLDEEHIQKHGWGTPGEYVSFQVEDTGDGMDEETRKHIFEPFFTTKRAGAGTGLGMAMIYGLVKQLTGFVAVESEVGQGTTVTVYLPTADQPATEPAPHPAPSPRGGTETILLVEDEEAIRRAEQRILEREGYRVLVAKDGAEAMEMVHQHPGTIDLVVTDVVMPRMGGREFSETLSREGLRIPLLFTSGYTSWDLQSADTLAEDTPFLHKPWTAKDLLANVREILDRN